ncbi:MULTISPECIES: phosphoribosylanthranilate isomerase [Halobacterium]|nr:MULTISPECIES: phosphoribosylanthranilate isomerase [Halobacterium]MCF2165931.1 phosphoribosylanthranilate isomerase [Halobacterium salinarum]MCF2167450.1 phosphoribosylanthranilate isomerase [Halobacterium salinarum]MCF2207449.1 phosphoribosylanthranilate isomerase [Halobacterium salinarum]MCF2238859.1 phosphoribosylanthranilate isomerase [Halobacterium salinarum]MDL0125273.1 phosphoribosylanthranilate isomerase [Halobacterium salinarum]
MTRVKVCGLTTERDHAAAVAAGADAVGIIADVPVETPREVSVETATALRAATPPFVTSVLVTMPATPEHAVDLVRTVAPDAVQLHGDLPVGDAAYVAANTPCPVIKAVTAGDQSAARYADVVDALLVDSPSTDDAGAGGGTGRTHDWAATRAFADRVDTPVVLAGGLTPANVADAVDTVDPFAVDVASGVEARPGEKDHAAVSAFVARATATPDPTLT